MSIYKFFFKLILRALFVTIFFSQLQAKNFNDFNKGNYISSYFSGVLLLNNSQYKESYKSFKSLNGLEISHKNYSKKYLYSLVNLGKFNEAYFFSQKLEKKSVNNYESDFIAGIYHLKNGRSELAKKYFFKLKGDKNQISINNFIILSLLNWSSLDNLNFAEAKKNISSIDPVFENLKRIQNTFLYCFYQKQNVEIVFNNLISDKKTDFSRYNYFFANYLVNAGKISKAKKIINDALKLYPRNLLLNQMSLDLKKENINTNFDCKNEAHVIAEILYITANALSAQGMYSLSNYYLNLAKFLNNDFYSFNSLLAENFYKIENFEKAKKIYLDMKKRGSAFRWHSAKQIVKILKKEKKTDEAVKMMKKDFNNLQFKGIYEIFDYAEFLKSNEIYDEAIKHYSNLIKKIENVHPLYSEVTDGRGVSYERIGRWKEAEKDLLDSLKVNPNQAYVINYLAYSWIEKGINIEKSLLMLEKANKLKSNDPFIIDSLGWAFFKLKKYKKAKSYLQTAVELMPYDPVVNDHFGDVLWEYGNQIQARYYWKYALGLEDTEEKLKVRIKEKLTSGL